MRSIVSILIPFLTVPLFLYSCGDKESHGAHGTNIMEDAHLLAIYEREGYDEVYVVNVNGDEVAHYVLVDREDSMKYDFPEGVIEIKVPLKSAVLDSEVYASAFEELSAIDAITGMFDVSYVTLPEIDKKLKKSEIQDVGQSLYPNSEKIISLNPDALLISFYDGMQTQGLDKLGLPVIKMYDLQESSPLGRAEWIRFIGRLVGKEDVSDSIFSAVKKKYTEIGKERSGDLYHGPKVLTELIYEGTWYVPGGKSYQAQLIQDAGGNYFKSEDSTEGTLNLMAETVLQQGGDADVWLIKYFGDENQIKAILNSDPVYKEIKAWKEGNVYFSNTSKSGLFREFPFHPEGLLKDYKIIFEGDSITELRYFKKLNKE